MPLLRHDAAAETDGGDIETELHNEWDDVTDIRYFTLMA